MEALNPEKKSKPQNPIVGKYIYSGQLPGGRFFHVIQCTLNYRNMAGWEFRRLRPIMSLNPNWMFDKDISIDTHMSQLPKLVIDIFDKDTISDDFLGKVVIPLSGIVANLDRFAVGPLPLTDHNNRRTKDSLVKGFVLAHAFFVSQGSS